MAGKTYKLKNVRLRYPNLFSTESYKGTDTGKYSATFILDAEQHKEILVEMQAGIEEMITTELKVKKLDAGRICLKDGDDSGSEFLEGKFTVKASNKFPITILSKSREVIKSADESPFYPGCYVNAIIDFWPQQGDGKRINSNLLGIQFSKNGERISEGSGIDINEFDDLGDDEDEFESFK